MYHFGIIGKPLEHSFSARYFADKFQREQVDAEYLLCPVADASLIGKAMEQFDGFNVTYPYKEAILLHLPELDKVAHEIGAVNVVCHGKGYNTDWIGFRDSVRPLLREHDRRVLLLGTGGVSKAIQYALQEMGLEYTVVSRLGGEAAKRLQDKAREKRLEEKGAERLRYQEVDKEVMQAHTVIVNCTPLGMHPYDKELPAIPYEYLTEDHLLYDCIYNPAKTLFLQMGEEHGCRIKNGLEMLFMQADEAWRIWSGQQL